MATLGQLFDEEVDTTGRGVIQVMDRDHGDYKVIWNPDDDTETEQARKTFNDLRKKGYAAYSVKGKNGDRGSVISDFDPEAGRIIMAPPMVGG